MTQAAIIATLLNLFEAVLNDIPEAMSAYDALKAMSQSGADPTPEQWAALDAVADASHARLQAVGTG